MVARTSAILGLLKNTFRVHISVVLPNLLSPEEERVAILLTVIEKNDVPSSETKSTDPTTPSRSQVQSKRTTRTILIRQLESLHIIT